MKPQGLRLKNQRQMALGKIFLKILRQLRQPNGNVLDADKDGDNTGRPSVLATWLLIRKISEGTMNED